MKDRVMLDAGYSAGGRPVEILDENRESRIEKAISAKAISASSIMRHRDLCSWPLRLTPPQLPRRNRPSLIGLRKFVELRAFLV